MTKNVLLGLLWGVILCTLLSLFGCKTKKNVIKDSYTAQFDSVRVEKEIVKTSFSIIDTTKTDELTTTIREFFFDTFTVDSAKSIPMIVVHPDGSVTINHGLKMYKEQTQSRKKEKKGVVQHKDSTVNKNTNTNVSKETKKKHKDKQVERVQVAEPFKWWQMVVGMCVLLVVVVALLRGKSWSNKG